MLVCALAVSGLVAGWTVGLAGASVPGTAPWTGFGFDTGHSSHNAAATSVTPQNAAALNAAWTFVSPPPTITGQPCNCFTGAPAVADGMVFSGSNDGIFYALNEATGKVVWSKYTGFLANYGCSTPSGIKDSPAVATDPTTGKPTVYFATAAGVLYALDAATGTVLWQTNVFPPTASSAPFIWSSPTVYNGSVYIGISSECDNPLTRGGLMSFSQATGANEATFWTVNADQVGGSIWSTAAASPAGIFVSTGNGKINTPAADQGLSNSIVLLDPTTLAPIDHWTVPNISNLDDDFGSSPTLFSATINGQVQQLVGACNKNGDFYALEQNALSSGPIWQDALGNSATGVADACLSTASWDGSHLLITTNSSTINGVTYPAVARELDPATGAILWETPLSVGPVVSISAVNGTGVEAFGTYNPGGSNPLTLLNTTTGAQLATYTMGADAGGPVWADGYLIAASGNGKIYALQPPPTPAVTAISPNSGPTSGGTSVSVTGTNFASGDTVSFGGTAATSVTVASATSLSATAPAGSGTVDLTVTGPGGTSATVAADRFTFTNTTCGPSPEICSVGSMVEGHGNVLTSLSVNPQTVGDAMVLMVRVASATITVGGVSGGGASWTKVTGYQDATSHDLEVWLGTVTTAGPSTLHVTYSASTTSLGVELVAQEFTAGLGGSSVWTKDVAAGQSNPSSITIPSPSLTAAGTGELYVGYSRCPTTVLAGSTPGVTYDSTSGGSMFLYDPSVTGTLAPSSAQATANKSSAVGALIAVS